MDRDDFVEMLAREGFKTTVLVEREANGVLDHHSHEFEAKALILEGDLTIRVKGVDKHFKPGDVFHLLANVEHSERYGAKGVCYLVGRK